MASDIDFDAPVEEPRVTRSPLEQAQRALGWLGLRHETVMDLFRLAPAPLDDEVLMEAGLHVIAQHMHAEASSVILVDDAAGDLFFAAATGPVAGDIKAFRLDRGEGIAGWCIETGRVVRITDVHAEPRWHSQISRDLGFDVRQLLAAPIRWRNRTVGCLELVNKLGGEIFEPEDEEVVAEAATCLGLLLAARERRLP